MNDLHQLIATKSGPLLMTHMIAGYPTAQKSLRIARVLVESGADILELQIPFSDSMADGPTIAVACQDALKSGATVAKSLTLAKQIAVLGKPVIIMSYINPVFRYGISRFVRRAARAGVSALIVPDCPFDSDEGKDLLAACAQSDVYLIPVVSPGVTRERLLQIAKDARGFVYCTSRQGTTGTKGVFARELGRFVHELKDIFQLPIAVGFGVKSQSDAETLKKYAEIVVVGSALVAALKNNRKNTLHGLRALVCSLRDGLV